MNRAVGLVAVLLSGGPAVRQSAVLPACDPDNGGITLPAGFCAVVVADQVGAPRHLAVAPNGDLFVALQSRPGGVLALRDTTGDGKADITERFGSEGGSGIALGKGVLYFSSTTTVYRYAIRAGSLVPLGEPDVIVRGLPNGGHAARNLALAADGRTLFVNIGSATNSCQGKDRSNESPGEDPCPELAYRAGVWRFDATKDGQTQANGTASPPASATPWGSPSRPQASCTRPSTAAISWARTGPSCSRWSRARKSPRKSSSSFRRGTTTAGRIATTTPSWVTWCSRPSMGATARRSDAARTRRSRWSRFRGIGRRTD